MGCRARRQKQNVFGVDESVVAHWLMAASKVKELAAALPREVLFPEVALSIMEVVSTAAAASMAAAAALMAAAAALMAAAAKNIPATITLVVVGEVVE